MRVDWKHEAGRAVRVEVLLEESDVHLVQTPIGVQVEIADCHNGGEPGAPALPHRVLHVALPVGTWPEAVQVHESKVVALTREAVLVVPVQPLAPGARRKDACEGSEDDSAPDHAQCQCRCCRHQPVGGPWEDPGDQVDPFPAPPIVPPDPTLYEAAASDPDPARLTQVQMIGPAPVVTLVIRPVRYTERGTLELVRGISIEIPYSERPRERASDEELDALLKKAGVGLDPKRLQPLPVPEIHSAAQAGRFSDILKGTVINPELLDLDRWRYIYPQLPADYVIITDHQTWNAETITPIAPLGGDMVAQFERLAAHKRSRGVSAKVVTISDIVNGRYGDFRSGSRDLQEMLRKFVKHAYRRWGTAWLLLGGDLSVVPARSAAGAIEGHMDVAANDPPDDNQSFWTGTFLKMHVVGPGTWWPGTGARQLINAGTGQLIPFDATGATATSGTGWYFTAGDYATRSVMATEFVRVNGPAAVVNARLQWLYEWNRIPTDLYYASLDSWVIAYHEISFWLFSVSVPYVYFPPHDWDALDNGLYGQYVNGIDVDGVHWRTDLSVGRAPVQSGEEAQAFVDKTIAYAGVMTQTVFWGQSSWLERVLIAASNWGGGIRVSRGAASPPGSARFHAGTHATVANLGSTPSFFGNQLIAEISDSDRRELPYNASSGPTSRGWHFARSAVDHAQPAITFTIFGAGFTFPLPSQWIVVHGPASERDPPSFLFDPMAQDGSMTDQELLREQLDSDIPAWSEVARLYEDMTDLTPAQAAAAPIGYLTSTRLQTTLNGRPHIVSLSGHGAPGGCCGAGVWMANALANGKPGFIGYADSCLTGAFDSEDAFAEALIKNPDGGAVAYVGNTRFSWIGLGDDIQRAFFARLKQTRHLGLLNDCRLAALDFSYWHAYARWVAFSLTLFGDPELRVWTTVPRVIWPRIRWRKSDFRIPVEVELPRPPRPVETGRELPAHYFVSAHQADGFEYIERVEAGSKVYLDLHGAKPGTLTVTVTADAPGYAPYEKTFEIAGPHWLRGRVEGILHREDAHPWTRVDLRTTDGCIHRLVASGPRDTDTAGSCDAIVEALLESHTSGVDIALLVDNAGSNGRIEGFKLPA